MAGSSSVNFLSCRIPYQCPSFIHAWTPFSEKALFFTEFCFVTSPRHNSVPRPIRHFYAFQRALLRLTEVNLHAGKVDFGTGTGRKAFLYFFQPDSGPPPPQYMCFYSKKKPDWMESGSNPVKVLFKSGRNPLKSSVFKGTRRTPTGRKK